MDVLHSFQQIREDAVVEIVDVLGHGFADELLEVVPRQLAPANGEHRAREVLLLRQAVERREGHPAREVAGDTEDHERVRRRAHVAILAA